MITVAELVEKHGFNIVAGKSGLENNVNGVYIGDLLSWVMGRAGEENAWLTIQGHVNIIAVALLTCVSCIIVCEGAEVDFESKTKADNEDIPILTTKLSTYDAAKVLMNLGL